MNKNEILELLFQKYKQMPQENTCDKFLSDLIININDKTSTIDVEKEFKSLINTIAFDNFYEGFKTAINIMRL